MTDRRWYESHDNLVGLASWLDSECDEFPNVSNCIRFFEKPWKWTREFQLWRMWLNAEGNPEKCERIREALDEETSAEDLMAEWDG